MGRNCYWGLYRTPDSGTEYFEHQCNRSPAWLAFYGAWGLTTLWCDGHKPAHTEGVILAKIEEPPPKIETVWGLLQTNEKRNPGTFCGIPRNDDPDSRAYWERIDAAAKFTREVASRVEKQRCHSLHTTDDGSDCIGPLVSGECPLCGFQVGDYNPYSESYHDGLEGII